MYRTLADLVLLAHALFLAFVVFGGLLVLWKPRLMAWHLIALAWGVIVVGLGLICPLTPLENMLRQLAGEAGYTGGFIEHYVMQILYPAGLTRGVQVLLAVALVLGNVLVYAAVFARRRRCRARSQ